MDVKVPFPAIAAALLILAPATAGAQAAPPSADEYYTQALERMKALPEPLVVTYDASVDAYGARFLLNSSKGRASFALVIGSGGGVKQGTWQVAARTSDVVTSIAVSEKTRALSASPIFNATWNGAYNFMRYGLDGPATNEETAASAGAIPGSQRVIAMVKAIGTGYYRAQDAGAGTCSGGVAGHNIHLIARSDPQGHPLTDVTIDTASGLICTMRFGFRDGGPVDVSGFAVLHLGRVGVYQMISDEQIELNLRVMGIEAKRVGMIARYEDVAFPASLPPALFPSP